MQSTLIEKTTEHRARTHLDTATGWSSVFRRLTYFFQLNHSGLGRVLLRAGLMGMAIGALADTSIAQSVNPVIQWNRSLLVIVRTHGAQPATIHPTRSFALMHAAIYDAVNAIDRAHKPYLVSLEHISRSASQDAAAAAAAHEVLIQLYPAFQTMLDAQLPP